MAFSLLPALRPGDWNAVICVRVCQKWSYRGGSDDGPIHHVDLVLVDEQGNSLYAEIPGTEVETKSRLIDEGDVYVISRFRVSNAKSAYRAVDAPFMVEFTLHTTVTAPRSCVPDIPRYAYKITPIDGLPAHAGDNKNFLDTIGTLVEVSNIQTVHLPNKPASTVSRHIILRDLSYSEVKITLWGHRATAFTTEGVYDKKEAKPIVVLFVGGLMKSYQSNYYLSGNAACRWYFNPDIPEARPFYASYQNQRLEIRSVVSPMKQQIQARVATQLEEKSLRDLNAIGPYEFGENQYRCTVTIGRLLLNASWWFPSCTRCSKACAPDGAGYKCGACSNSSFKYKYKVSFIALDGTDEAEMIAFGDIARRIIGKPVQQLLRTSTGANVYPPEISRLVSLRFTFAITMTKQSYYKPKKTYNVSALVTSHGQPLAVPPAPANSHGADHSDAESGNSSDKTAGRNAHVLSPTATPDSTQGTPGLLDTPPPSLAGIETPLTKKHARGEPSGVTKHPSCHRRLLVENSDDDDETVGANISGSSAAIRDGEAGQGDASVKDHSAQESG